MVSHDSVFRRDQNKSRSPDRHAGGSATIAQSVFNKMRVNFFGDGELVRFGGDDVKIFKVPNPMAQLEKSERLTSAQKAVYSQVIEALLPIREYTNQIASKQSSESALGLIEWLGKVVDAVPETRNNERVLRQLRVYNMFISQNLMEFDMHKSAKYVPAFTKDELMELVKSIKDDGKRSELLASFDTHSKTLFSAEPMPPGANLFRFKTEADRQYFFDTLSVDIERGGEKIHVSAEDYKQMKAELEEAVRKFGEESSESENAKMKRISKISREMKQIVEVGMKTQVEAAKGEHDSDLNTIVYMHYVDGKMKTETVTYEKAFEPELKAISECFSKASELAKEVSPKLSEQLALLSEATLSGDYTKAHEARYRITPNDSYISVGFDYQETYAETVLQRKGMVDFRISIIDENEHPVLQKVREDPRFKDILNIGQFHNFVVAGFNSQFTLGGQKLPNEDGQPIYLDVVFSNITELSQEERRVKAYEILVLPNKDEDMKKMLEGVLVQIILHETGHMLGLTAEHLFSNRNATEECQASASAVQLAKELAQEYVEGVVLRTVTLGPLSVKVGIGGPHAKADIYTTGRMIAEGALRISEDNKLEVLDYDKAVRVAAQIARECRILERPEAHLEEARVLLMPELNETGGDLKAAASKRAERMFGNDNVSQLAETLKPVAENIAKRPVGIVVFGYLDNPMVNKI